MTFAERAAREAGLKVVALLREYIAEGHEVTHVDVTLGCGYCVEGFLGEDSTTVGTVELVKYEPGQRLVIG